MALEKIDAQTQLKNHSGDGGLSLYGSRNLSGSNNAVSSTTKFDISADMVILWRPSDNNTVLRTSTGTLTCDKDVSGPVANGRDQSGAFVSGNFVHLYFIWNGTTLATIMSLTAPPTGPTLPSGYTHWCYAATLLFGGGNFLKQMRLRGNRMYYISSEEILNGGFATSSTEVQISSVVPTIAVNIAVVAQAYAEDYGEVKLGILNTNTTGILFTAPPNSAVGLFGGYYAEFPNESVYYSWTSAATGRLLYLYIHSFDIPNGAS